MMTNNSNCPSSNHGAYHQPKCGYATSDTYREYLRFVEGNDGGKYDDEHATISKSLVADPDRTKPLYIWQLYSILGKQPIVDIVTDFYARIYDDHNNEWFRDVFAQISGKHHHIMTQAAYWIDAMGGGRVYHGGNYRLNFHHTYNANDIMTAKGAKVWMSHMTNAINSYDFVASGHDDPRIKPTIVTFLKMKMMKYSNEHNWEFDESDFYELEQAQLEEKESSELSELVDNSSNNGDASSRPINQTSSIQATTSVVTSSVRKSNSIDSEEKKADEVT